MRGHVAKKGDRYYIVIDLGRDHKNKRKQKWISGYTRKKDAENDLPRILMKYEQGYQEPVNMTFEEYLHEWLRKKKQDVAHGTYHHYESYTRNHIIPGLGSWKLNQLDYDIIDSFIDEIKDDEELAQQTKRHIYRTLSNAIRQGKRYGLDSEVMEGISAPKKERKEIEYWTREEMRSFTKHLKSKNHRFPIMLALATGMRYGEVMGLTWSKVNLEKKYLSVTHQLKLEENKEGEKEWILSPTLKTQTSYRTISLDDDTVEMLKEHKKHQERNKLKIGPDYEELDLVCTTTIGGPIKPSYLRKVFNRTCEKAKVKRISFHGLRHTHATLLLSDGVHPKIVQERLGHRSIETTLDTYSHITPNMQQMAATSIQKSLHGKEINEDKEYKGNVVNMFKND